MLSPFFSSKMLVHFFGILPLSANHNKNKGHPVRLTFHVNSLSTVLLTSLGKTFFAWRFIINENILFWLTISYQKPFVFSVSVFCYRKFTTKLNLRPNIGLTYAISTVKCCFFLILYKKIFFTFLCWIWILMFHNIIVKISEKLNQRNLLKNCLQVTYPTDFCTICIFLLWRKVKIFDC